MKKRKNNRLKKQICIYTIATLSVLGLALATVLFLKKSPPEPIKTELPETVKEPDPPPEPKTISIDLVGDMNFADGWATDLADANGGSVESAFSPEILEHLRTADIFYANHEFTMSARGKKLGKYYTFRANPEKMTYWNQLGVDVVGLANNHAGDYGTEALLDTLDLLDGENIKHTGAGKNLKEAMTPAYFDIDGFMIAFVAADRSQKGAEVRAPEAKENAPGVLFCFDDALFLEAVRSKSLRRFRHSPPALGNRKLNRPRTSPTLPRKKTHRSRSRRSSRNPPAHPPRPRLL
ncbi:hypothetical protein FACS1894191_6210 [Clostridia bacterium]|nr:hypothetical protein FACS1894191_6210 [Clostridia bacterium]